MLLISIIASACGDSAQPASVVSTPIAESPVSSVDSAGSQSEIGAAAVSVPAPAISAPAPESFSAPANPYGPPTLDERIFFADAIAIVRLISSEPNILLVSWG